MPDPHTERLLILDFGSQYPQLIARRVREAGVYCEIWAFDHTLDEVLAFKPDGIIIFGDDQYENFKEDCVPPFCVHIRDTIESQPFVNAQGGPARNGLGKPFADGI